MLDKTTNSVDVYKPTKNTTITVKNKKIETVRGETTYAVTVSIKHTTGLDKPLNFADADEIADFINNVDLDNNQLSLIGKDQ